MSVTLTHFLILSSILFCIGLLNALVKRHAIAILIGIELMLNAANINLVAFARYDPQIEGQIFSLFVMVVAAAEVVVGLTIIFLVYKHFQDSDLERFHDLGEGRR